MDRKKGNRECGKGIRNRELGISKNKNGIRKMK